MDEQSDSVRRQIGDVGDRLTKEIDQTTRMLIWWTSTLIFVTGILAFIAGRFV